MAVLKLNVSSMMTACGQCASAHHVVVEKRGEHISFDFSGSDDQRRPANIRPPVVRGAIAYCLIALVDPHISSTAD